MSDLLFPIISMVLLVLAEAGVLQFTGRQKSGLAGRYF